MSEERLSLTLDARRTPGGRSRRESSPVPEGTRSGGGRECVQRA